MSTGEDVFKAVEAAGIKRIDHHDCGMCGYMTRYLVHAGELFFDAGCDCVRHPPPPRLCSWDDAADWINMQTNEDARNSIMRKFGLEPARPPSPAHGE